ncbi:Hypothetical protein LUCI_3944 [Lucifera butyrica]|uniref:Zinc-ribbon domain-containing protein n=1 Tax=Lucifera butyrica TaxID=1351585 RepID=A0A498R7D4_9FIRM|nr:hypothetical protein [Lucifera butyrica]VBB08666.1 Hypothetical protein LUCI_3944 [Lucifera butyrica]
MRCYYCGAEKDTIEEQCPHCGRKETEVQILSREEREGFQGVTIEGEPDPGSNGYQEDNNSGGNRIYVRHIQFGSNRTGFWTRLLIGAILAGIILIALPLAVFLAVAGSLIWFLFRRR